MDFWRAYRVVAARKWLILAVTLVAGTVVGIGLLLFGRKWDGATMIVPSDLAVRRAASSLNDDRNMPALTDDARTEEARKIAVEIAAPDTAANAVTYLAAAPILRGQLGNSLAGKDIGGAGYDNYDEVAADVKTAIAQLGPKGVADVEQSTGIPSDLWADFLYLRGRLEKSGVSLTFLAPNQAALSDTVADLYHNIEVEILNSRDIKMTVREREKAVAEVLASAVTAAYKHVYDSENRRAVEATKNFYQRQNGDAVARFARAQAAMRNFRQTHRDIFMPDQVSLAIRDANNAQQQVNQTQSDLDRIDAQLSAMRARLASLPRMLKHPVQADSAEITSLRNKISEYNAQIAEKSAVWTDTNPEMARMKAQLKALKDRLGKVEGSLVTTTTYTENDEFLKLERDIAGIEQNRKGLAATLNKANSVLGEKSRLVATLPEANTSSQLLNAEFNSAAEQLTDSSKKLRAANEDLAKTEAGGSLAVRYWAGASGTPAHPESQALEGAAKRNWVMFIAAILLSLAGSIAVVLGLDYLDTSLKSTMDVERMLDVPVNGVVPRLEGASRAMLPQVTHKLPASAQAESYRFLGTDILLSAAGDEPFKTIMVATAKPGQGGTSTICNLAITLAQAGQTVALVDADMRRPSLHSVFNIPNDQGLTTVLSNGKIPSDVLQRTEIENLYVMTGGPHADNAWKLLRSARMKDVIADLQRDFDFVLFDTPSAAVFADAATLASMVDGVLLVVRAHEAPSGSEMQVKNLLNKTKARIVGVVLNDMPVQQVDSARYFTHYYSSARPELDGGAAAPTAKPALPKRGMDDEI